MENFEQWSDNIWDYLDGLLCIFVLKMDSSGPGQNQGKQFVRRWLQ